MAPEAFRKGRGPGRGSEEGLRCQRAGRWDSWSVTLDDKGGQLSKLARGRPLQGPFLGCSDHADPRFSQRENLSMRRGKGDDGQERASGCTTR